MRNFLSGQVRVKNVGGYMGEYKADFLWPHEKGSVEQAGYEFANAKTEEYREQWWNILIERIAQVSGKVGGGNKGKGDET